MDFLSQLIQEKSEVGLWKPVKTSRSGPSFFHLFFADDLVFFAKATPENCVVVKEVLDMFCKASSQTISDAKSRVFFSPNIDQDSKEALSSTLGFQATNCLGKYIGFPIKHRGRSNQDFNFALDKVKKKLAGWKANLFLWQEGQCSSRLLLQPYQLMLCSAICVLVKFWRGLTELIGTFFGAHLKIGNKCIGWVGGR